MEPKTRVRILDTAPPQWRGLKGRTAERRGEYWLIDLDRGGLAVMHRTEIAEDKPAEPEAGAVMVGWCRVEVPRSALDLAPWDRAMREAGF